MRNPPPHLRGEYLEGNGHPVKSKNKGKKRYTVLMEREIEKRLKEILLNC
jgi:hypothetical protein